MTAAAQTGAQPAGPALPRAAGVLRRLASFTYEGVLLFGVVMIVGLLYGVLTRQAHELAGSTGLKMTLFVVLGVYFTYFWSRHGQTLAMKTWGLRLEGPDGRRPSPYRAVARYLFAWLWFLPALSLASLSGLKGGAAITAVVLAGVLAYACLCRLRADRQFLHDAVCGTRVIDVRPSPNPGLPR